MLIASRARDFPIRLAVFIMESRTCALTPRRIAILICVGVGVLLFWTINSSVSPAITFQTESTVPSSYILSTAGAAGQQVHKEQHFPQAIIIGVKKGGTRALVDILKSHPQIVSPRGEIHFFDRNETFRHGVNWYIKKMPYSTPDQITMEKSPSYFVTPKVPSRIHSLSPTAKLLLIVRNPIDRAISDYAQLFNPTRLRNGKNRSFDDLVLDKNNHVDSTTSLIRVSCYDMHMAQWLKFFTLGQMHIVNGDALIHDPAPEVIRVQEFLGLNRFFHDDMFYYNDSKGFYCWRKITDKGSIQPKCLGSGKGRPHPRISNSTHELLKQYFTSHNDKFFELVKTHFNWNDYNVKRIHTLSQ